MNAKWNEKVGGNESLLLEGTNRTTGLRLTKTVGRLVDIANGRDQSGVEEWKLFQLADYHSDFIWNFPAKTKE
jgi:hypothetical protein